MNFQNRLGKLTGSKTPAPVTRNTVPDVEIIRDSNDADDNVESVVAPPVQKGGTTRTVPPEPRPVRSREPDEIGTYPAKVDVFSNRAKRVYRNLRIEYIIIGVLLITNLVQANLLSEMFPLYRVVPFFVTFSDKAEQVVRIDPPSGNLRSLDILTENNVREYIKLRNTISQDDVSNFNRWSGKVKEFSEDGVFQAFLDEIKPVHDAAMKGQFTRNIVIDAVQAVQANFYRVEFTAYDRKIGSGLTDTVESRKTFIAELRVANQPRRITYSKRFDNPLGFTVLAYAVVPKRDSSN
ncbi:VirB8/TrbF family protein [Microvirga tunisiensis]|uniref:Bacterial virulence protein VirB8 domain-containing protein n=1 Tax=Microvirga tunisiensis TaxID=2108360 RepID=A0A5N7MM88_9HYPH|nr:VirB8/TrbF family protein [Microvirga tunisiensis]MPR09530.1 hypothetical protein [Microvirga tunisiensis]MPR27750.1 hypothetical protein [Microvirga tunisiensis]